ncbi:MAG: hypothetical protein AAFY91_01020, partial [Bacteroidota bacterium]
ALCSSLVLLGQQQLPGNQNIYDTDGPGFIYNKEFTVNVGLMTPRNLMFGFTIGQIQSYDVTSFWSIELGDHRHPREFRSNFERIILANNRVSRAFTYGKQNQLYVARLGFGKRKYWSEKARQRGVAMGYSYRIGPTLGLLKPYYLEVAVGEPGNGALTEIRYTGDNGDLFLDRDRIFGAASFGRGLGEISFVPAVHARASIHFGFGAYDELAKSLEAGIQAEYFLGEVPIMVDGPAAPGVNNSQLFLNLFLALQIGKRY